MEIENILKEDERRRLARLRDDYDPEKGRGCFGQRVEAISPSGGMVFIPLSMTRDLSYKAALASSEEWDRLRCRHDFEYWAFTCVKIRDKLSGNDVPLRLNKPQRKVLAILETDRLAGLPIRLILLKARQWGGSTLIQMYMAWIQLCHRRNWNSVICAHVKDTAGTIRGMYTKLLANYPMARWEGDEGSKPEFKCFERSINTREIAGRGCRVTVASSENQEAVRGADYAMAHLSEVAFWRATPNKSPEDFIRAICGSVTLEPLTLIALESTANGVGNYFHSEWLRSKRGESDKHAIFIPWYEIEIYSRTPVDRRETARKMMQKSYLSYLWKLGCDLDQINWYIMKSSEYTSEEKMMAEFPTTDTEAFTNTGFGVFSQNKVEKLRESCCEAPLRGEINSNGDLTEDEVGNLTVWKRPEVGRKYIAAVDVGGRSAKSDFSVIAVLDISGSIPEVVAQWRGHCDHDILADKAVDIARFYNKCLLVVESNTLETGNYGGENNASDNGNLFVLNRIADKYDNLYCRRVFDSVKNEITLKYGFHTNRSTKPMLVGELVEAVRNTRYIERDSGACDELLTYEQKQNGTYGAKPGYHDDIIMTRAMALLVAATEHLIHRQVRPTSQLSSKTSSHPTTILKINPTTNPFTHRSTRSSSSSILTRPSSSFRRATW